MHDENTFNTAADATLLAIADRLEPYDAAGKLEADLMDGVLTIEFSGGQQLVISKHAPSGQIWLSSPISGGLHFSPQNDYKDWQLTDGRSLKSVLDIELQSIGVLETEHK